MKRILWQKPAAPYSLHDMNITAMEAAGSKLILRTRSGLVSTTPPYSRPDGWVELLEVQWDFSYAYLLDFTGNTGRFTGRKLFLRDFLAEFYGGASAAGFSVMDESYGFNLARYTGYLSHHGTLGECTLEVCHEGGTVFAAQE